MYNVVVLQQILPKYRVPFFEKLAENDQCRIHLFIDESFMGHKSYTERQPEGVVLEKAPIKKIFSRFFWQYNAKMLDALSEGDVLVLSGNPWFLSNYYLVYKARRKKVGILWWGQGFSITSNKLRLAMKQFLMKMAHTWMLYTSEEVKRYRKFGFDPDRLFSAENTLDTKAIQNEAAKWTPQRLDAFQKDHALTHRKCLVFCSRLTPKTNLSLIIDALPEILKRHPDTLLLIIGDGPLKQPLETRIANEELTHSVYFTGAIHEEATLAPWFLSAQVFVYPGAVGLSILHGLSYGLPIVLHEEREKHNPEIAAFEQGVNGLAFKENDPVDLAAQINQLLDDTQLRQRMAAGALHTVKSRFNMDIMAGNFERAFRKTREMVLSKNIVRGN